MTVGFAILASCSQENIPISPTEFNETPSNPYRITLKEALKTADNLMSRIEGGKTRSSFRTVNDVRTMTLPKTRGDVNPIDTAFYIVNYADNKGFAVLSADKRLDPVYAISERGSLHESDTIDNPALGVFFRQMRSAGIPPFAPNDSTINSTITGGENADWEDPDDTFWQPGFSDNGNKYGPIIPPAVRTVDLPKLVEFNMEGVDSTYIDSNTYIAYLMMSTYCWPESYNGHRYNWLAIQKGKNKNGNKDDNKDNDEGSADDGDKDDKGDSKDDENKKKNEYEPKVIKDLFKDLTMEAANIGIAPPKPSSAADDKYGRGNNYQPDKFSELISKFGYAFEDGNHPYVPIWENKNLAKRYIFQNSPLILSSQGFKWITDGWWNYGTQLESPYEDGSSPAFEIFHFVWPNKSQNNGWFRINGGTSSSSSSVIEPGETQSDNNGTHILIYFIANKLVKINN